MGTSPSDSERAPMAERQPLAPEQPGAAGRGLPCPSGPLGQDWAPSKPAAVELEEEEEDGPGCDVEGMCPPHQGGVQLEEQPLSPGSLEEASSCSWASGEEGSLGEPLADPRGSPEPQGLPPTAKEEDGKVVLAMEEGSSGTLAGQELPLVEEDAGGMGHVGLLRDTSLALGHGTQSCCIQAEDAGGGDEQECPICTELYDHDRHRPALLNCGHVLCGQCLHAIMEAASAADIGRVRCPICRQKTPMMEWEICRLQEELLLLGAAQGPALAPPPAFQPLPARPPGLWGGLEHHFQVRFHTSRMFGFLPCLRYPPCLIAGLARLRRRCRGCYLLALALLLGAETLSLLLVFLPIVLLLLLFLVLDK